MWNPKKWSKQMALSHFDSFSHWEGTISIANFMNSNLPYIMCAHFPSNKSEKFPKILQLWWLFLKNFQGISQGTFPVTDSS